MPFKRGREAFEEDLQTQQSPYVFFGTTLPPLDPSVRDDGSYVPVWKQTVTDERGRRRLHGAFTGGFSAGYFNTVGSKEGWTPSNFVSSRDKKMDTNARSTTQRPEDFMDEEDLADAAEAEHIHTSKSFSTIGSSQVEQSKISLASSSEDTVGMKLLQRMGWRQGQGIGPRIKRKADLGKDDDSAEEEGSHLFAPLNSPLILLVKKGDSKGLGFGGSSRKPAKGGNQPDRWLGLRGPDLDDGHNSEEPGNSGNRVGVKKTGFGVGILNDTGSDDEDPYAMGPSISLSSIASKKPKAKKHGVKKAPSKSNPRMPGRPLLLTKRTHETPPQTCHDGKIPLRGFVLASRSTQAATELFPVPRVPQGWSSSLAIISKDLTPLTAVQKNNAVHGQDPPPLDPTSRARILGEAPLKGKSVFDFMTSEARNRLASATGKTDLPPGRGEQGPRADISDGGLERVSDLLQPPSDDIVKAALVRIATGWTPYTSDKDKAVRYRTFLEACSQGSPEAKIKRPLKLGRADWIKELEEFAHAARVFKPVSGMMASRFTAASTPSSTDASSKELLSQATKAPETGPQAAARANMFGPLTRSVQSFFPSRLLCKRFGVPPPNMDTASRHHQTTFRHLPIADKPTGVFASGADPVAAQTASGEVADIVAPHSLPSATAVDVQSNNALEGPRASESIFDAIFNS